MQKIVLSMGENNGDSNSARPPDLMHFRSLSKQLVDEICALNQRLREYTGCEDFNANSGDQVAEYLFDTLKIDSIKETKGGARNSDMIAFGEDV